MRAQRHPAATRDDHEVFCTTEDWEQTKTATAKRCTRHVTYELALDEGRRLRARISRPVDRTTYGASLWAHVLRDQLDVREADFRACVQDGVVPARSRPATPSGSLPADLVALLIHTVRVDEAVVHGMSRDDAVARLNQCWTVPAGGPGAPRGVRP